MRFACHVCAGVEILLGGARFISVYGSERDAILDEERRNPLERGRWCVYLSRKFARKKWFYGYSV